MHTAETTKHDFSLMKINFLETLWQAPTKKALRRNSLVVTKRSLWAKLCDYMIKEKIAF